MRATIVGKARNLSIACENTDKRVLGDIYVQGYEFIREAFGDEGLPGQFPPRVEGFISVFAQGSEALRRLLVVRNLEERYQQVIDRFTDLRNLTTFDKDGAKLVISVMLNAADFKYFYRVHRNEFLHGIAIHCGHSVPRPSFRCGGTSRYRCKIRVCLANKT